MSKATIKTVNGSTITLEQSIEDKELLKGLSVDQVFYEDSENLTLDQIEKIYEHEINKEVIKLLKQELDYYRKDIKELTEDLDLAVKALGNLLYYSRDDAQYISAGITMAEVSLEELLKRKKNRDSETCEEFDKDEF